MGFACDDKIYSIMRSCWEVLPEARPSFQQLSAGIENYIVSVEGSYDACWHAMADN